MLEDELRDILRDLLRTTRAVSAAIERPHVAPRDDVDDGVAESNTSGESPDDGSPRRLSAPLGQGWQLVVSEPASVADGTPAALERASRAVRAAIRRWNGHAPAEVHVAAGRGISQERVLERVESYLRAFANTGGVDNAVLTVAGRPVAAANGISGLETERLPFLLKQLSIEIERHKGETSHVELVQSDVILFAFWIEACLIAFVASDCAEDFVRHRARLVTRELSHLLPFLDDDDPGAQANVAPLPPRSG